MKEAFIIPIYLLFISFPGLIGEPKGPIVEVGPTLPIVEEAKLKPIEPIKLSEDIKPLEPVKPITPPSNSSSSSSGWHRECRSRTAEVKAEVERQGLGQYWTYINFIFSHESCNDPGRLNAGGCRGLGQACPGSKLPCGPEDIACQVKWFNGYAQGKGGWAASYNFWLANNWW